jgi:C4-dicarboxylate-specific signal transduction histidine kinase
MEDALLRGEGHPLQKKIKSLQELLEISRRLNSTLDLRTILKDLVVTSCTVLKAESASLLLLDERTGELEFRVTEGEAGSHLEGLRIKPGEGIAGHVATTGQRRIITNVRQDPDFCGRFDTISGVETRSLMAVPLAYQNRIYGVLELVNMTPYVRAEDVDHIETVASIAAQAVANAELMAQLKQHQAELVQASKLASIGTIAAGVAHELNQPLTGIRAFTQLLLRKQGKGTLTQEDLTDRLTRIDRQVDRMTRIIEHLQIFARQHRVAQESVNLHEVLTDTFILLEEQLRLRNIELHLDLAESLPNMLGDRVRLEEVVLNLVTNARDAMEAKGQGRLALRTWHAVERRQVCLEVRDSGGGIPAELVDRIFDPFFTTKDPGKGTGLGLSIVHGIIEEHHGHIQVESTEGVGTLFTLSFPVEG